MMLPFLIPDEMIYAGCIHNGTVISRISQCHSSYAWISSYLSCWWPIHVKMAAGCNQFLDTNRIAFSGHAVTQSLQEWHLSRPGVLAILFPWALAFMRPRKFRPEISPVVRGLISKTSYGQTFTHSPFASHFAGSTLGTTPEASDLQWVPFFWTPSPLVYFTLHP